MTQLLIKLTFFYVVKIHKFNQKRQDRGQIRIVGNPEPARDDLLNFEFKWRNIG